MRLLLRSLFILCLGLSTIFIFFESFSEQLRSLEYQVLTIPVANISDEIALFSTCQLAELGLDGGWTEELVTIADVNFDPIKNCNQNFSTYTVLGENGTVWLNPEKLEHDRVVCKARTIHFKDERNVDYGRWSTVERTASTAVFNSDFVHTSCNVLNDEENVVEEFVHSQIWNANSTFSKNDEMNLEENPSVFIFVLDSVASSQALRALPKTISLLTSDFGAVNLRHVNKVGENSHPNGIAFLIGKLITDMDKGIFGMSKEAADWNETHSCYRFFDDEPFILKEFTKKGYISLMAEDWANGVFTYPDCWGFKQAPATHYMRPFQKHYETNLTKSLLYMGSDQYSPMAALVWASELGHNNENQLFHADSQLLKYFTQHKDVMDNSYVFFMGDHGKRYGRERYTWIGEREINNPMLFVSVPRRLRKRINPILKKNSGELLTHFDVYASLVDILNEPNLRAHSGPSGLRGSSFFRPLPPGERTCRTLPIPMQYCLCEWNKTNLAWWSIYAKNDIVSAGVNLLNKKLNELKIMDKCTSYTLKKAKEVKMIDRTNGLWEILFATNECDAEFRANVRVRRMEGTRLNVSLVSNDFTRTNEYGNTAACMAHRAAVRPLCCCRCFPELFQIMVFTRCFVFSLFLLQPVQALTCFVADPSTTMKVGYRTLSGASREACELACERDATCVSFAYSDGQRRCVFENADLMQTPSCSTRILNRWVKTTVGCANPTSTTTAPSSTTPTTTSTAVTTIGAGHPSYLMGNDPCIIQSYPELVKLGRQIPCPQRNPDGSEGPVVVVRVLLESGERRTLPNVEMIPAGNKWFVNIANSLISVVAYTCATVDSVVCPCAPLTPPMGANCGQTPPAFGAFSFSTMPCQNKFWYTTFLSATLNSEAGNYGRLVCAAGMYFRYQSASPYKVAVIGEGCCEA